MKIRVEIDENLTEDEVVLRFGKYTEAEAAVQKAVFDAVGKGQKLKVYQQDTAYFIPYDEILFFETEGSMVYAHTGSAVYETKYRLYELLNILPGFFMRVSKSTILNVDKVYSLTNSLASNRVAAFKNSHKQVYVSRQYYKPLQIRLEEMRR